MNTIFSLDGRANIRLLFELFFVCVLYYLPVFHKRRRILNRNVGKYHHHRNVIKQITILLLKTPGKGKITKQGYYMLKTVMYQCHWQPLAIVWRIQSRFVTIKQFMYKITINTHNRVKYSSHMISENTRYPLIQLMFL